jgi:hypothetical protein
LRYVEPGVAPAYVPLSHTVIEPPALRVCRALGAAQAAAVAVMTAKSSTPARRYRRRDRFMLPPS